MQHWYDPIYIANLEIKNRIMMAPMCMYQAKEDGKVQPFHKVHYSTRAIGGVGLVMIEATAVESRGRISMNDLGIWEDEQIEGLKQLVEEVHRCGAKIGIQLAHAGRKAIIRGESAISPTDVPFSEKYPIPIRMNNHMIQEVVKSFRNAARRALKAGFDVIEIHGAHGYLINQFLSPLTNQREDAYGGSIGFRTHFLRDILDSVRVVWHGPTFVRLSAEEYAEGGHHIEETIQVVTMIQNVVDTINVSSGGVVLTSIPVAPLYQIPFSKAIKDRGMRTIGGGMVTTMEDVERIIAKEEADMVYLGRELLRNPYFVLNAAKKEGLNHLIPKAYERGY